MGFWRVAATCCSNIVFVGATKRHVESKCGTFCIWWLSGVDLSFETLDAVIGSGFYGLSRKLASFLVWAYSTSSSNPLVPNNRFTDDFTLFLGKFCWAVLFFRHSGKTWKFCWFWLCCIFWDGYRLCFFCFVFFSLALVALSSVVCVWLMSSFLNLVIKKTHYLSVLLRQRKCTGFLLFPEVSQKILLQILCLYLSCYRPSLLCH